MFKTVAESAWIPLPATEPGALAIQLEVTLYRPATDGPHPVVLFHHGSTGPRVRLPTETERPDEWGAHLAARGIALVVPMRRGRGQSGGKYFETYYGDLEASRSGIHYALESALAAEDYVRKQPWADARRILLAGSSRGGMLALWHAATRPGSCSGVLAFAPGWTSARAAPAEADVNLLLLDEIAGRVGVPTLLLYASADAYYPRERSQRYADRLCGAERSAKAEWLDTPDGHQFFRQSTALWATRADEFIGGCFAALDATS